MKKYLLMLAIALLSGLLIWLILGWSPGKDGLDRHAQLGLSKRPIGGDFQLTAVDGPVSLARLRGKVVLLYFGYTACPDICPTNLAIIALALRALTAKELQQVKVVFVSVDPQRDTPQRLADYVAYFHPNILGVTGSTVAVAAVAERYGAAFRRSEQSGSAMGYMVDHSAYTYVIDPAGRLVEVLDHATPAETIVATVRRYLPAVSN